MEIWVRLLAVRKPYFPRATAILSFLVLLVALPSLGLSQQVLTVPFTYQIGGTVPAPALYDITGQPPISVSLVTDGATWLISALAETVCFLTLTERRCIIGDAKTAVLSSTLIGVDVLIVVTHVPVVFTGIHRRLVAGKLYQPRPA